MEKLRSIFVAAMLLCCATLHAEDLTPAQKKFQNEIMKFLKAEGFAPSVDKDNSLTFKKEGELYWIDIEDEEPFYIEFHKDGLGCTGADMEAVLQACNKANNKMKCTKCIMNEHSVTIDIELFCDSADEFKRVFYRCLEALNTANVRTKEFYNEIVEGKTKKQ